MASTTMGVRLDDETRGQIKLAAQKIDRTPHWLIKQAIFEYLAQLSAQPESKLPEPGVNASRDEAELTAHPVAYQPFLEFAGDILPQSVKRAAITSAYRTPEPEAVSMLLPPAQLSPEQAQAAYKLAYGLAEKLRNQKNSSGRAGLVQGLLQEFSLSSQEGIALMCLAEALLRIPDKATRDALIRDKISTGDWNSHLGQSKSMFVNAATWGLLFTGKLVATHNEAGLSRSLNRILSKSGEPLVRKGVDMAMRLMGEQFVTGETIAQALANARKNEARGFRYSYDMLGEAALTEADAQAYLLSYQQAINAIGKASGGRGIYEGPGISIKLSALHPRYSRAQYDRVMDELYPRLLSLVLMARQYDIGINIDAEEADRLEISLDLLEKLCFDPQLAGWNGIGFVIQAYQKRCPAVVDYLIDLASRSQRRLMIRLVKGAYWDSEIKRAQVDGLEGYLVYTRKVYTDISYLACARKLLSVPNLIYPQFATHNAHTLSAIYHLAGNNYYPGQYEFQCLHGMGEPLYEQVVGKIADGKLNRPCRVYAPVGTHETLLAYLVRRLLENGANTSFVNRIADGNIPLETLVEDPVREVLSVAEKEGAVGLPHPKIPLPRQLFGNSRVNAAGLDLSNEHRLASLSCALLSRAGDTLYCEPLTGSDFVSASLVDRLPVRNPADHNDIVGHVRPCAEDEVDSALATAEQAAGIWFATPAEDRAAILCKAAQLMEAELQPLLGILVREAGKTYANAIAEVREAVDFLNYYAAQVRTHFANDTHRPLGPVVCISPWNFPLAIFTGQIAAALAAGNPVLAKPAEQTPLIASVAVGLLHQAGVPRDVLQLLPGEGETTGNQLVCDPRVRGVMFTGSTAVAKILQRNLAARLCTEGQVIPLIAETGGLNAMIVDSSALTEQVVTDVISSAFDSAGQRCSALRLLCIQEDVADRTITMLKGAMAECRAGNPEILATDIGPVIDEEAHNSIRQHIQLMRSRGKPVYQAAFAMDAGLPQLLNGTFIPPTLIELDDVTELTQEIFGPVLHVVRYPRDSLADLTAKINAGGYGLTFGIHTRIDETITQLIQQIDAGNIYVNRNIVGAVVGVQPFGGEGLSGTGPKAGGPLYLHRLLAEQPDDSVMNALAEIDNSTAPDVTLHTQLQVPFNAFCAWLQSQHSDDVLPAITRYGTLSQAGTCRLLPGPTGERNSYHLLPRGTILGLNDTEHDALLQLGATLATGCRQLFADTDHTRALYNRLPDAVRSQVTLAADWAAESVEFNGVIFHGDSDKLLAVNREIASRPGAIIPVAGLSHGETHIPLMLLMHERAVSVNTAAAGGNASLMTIG